MDYRVTDLDPGREAVYHDPTRLSLQQRQDAGSCCMVIFGEVHGYRELSLQLLDHFPE